MKKPMNQARVAVSRRGFALVITLSLMILLTIIAVGLLTLSSISLRSAAASSAMAEARQNARLSLMLAIGELQKYAGADQRTTATADIAGDAAGLPLPAGAQPLNNKSINNVTKGLSAVHAGTRYWTGIFANTDTPVSIYTKTPSPSIVHWLVSGNTTTYPTAGPTLLPSDSAYAVGSDGKVADSTKAVLLVGENTVGAGSIDRYVTAPLVALNGNNSTQPTGRFGWWVGDEGVKARINIAKTLDDKTKYAALTAQRRGWETIAGFSDYPTPSAGTHDSLQKVTTLAQTELLVPGVGGNAAGVSPIQSVFHSATADSRAVLADTLNGGTKVDLTALLSGALPTTSPVATLLNYPIKNSNVIARAGARLIRAPKWDVVKEFYDRFSQLDGGALVVKPATTDFVPAIAPMVIDFRMLMGARIVPKENMNVPLNSGIFSVNPCAKISVALANPYSFPLKWKSNIEIEVVNQTPPGNFPSRIWPLPLHAPGTPNDGKEGGAFAPSFVPSSTAEGAVFNKTVFVIKAGSLTPGEARCYMVAKPASRAAGSGTQRFTVELMPVTDTDATDFKNCVELQHPSLYRTKRESDGVERVVMDVRESWQTTIVALEMRLAGAASSQILRRIERFELDNGYFSPNQRKLTKADAVRMINPFPLMLYSFQISQPGVDYKAQLPSLYEMGQRGSTLRTFADFNLQATRVRKPIASYNPPPYFLQSNDSRAELDGPVEGGKTGKGFTLNLGVSPLRWGRSTFGSEKTVMFGVPSQFSSIAELQHADLTGDDLNASICHQPGNAVGNSYSTPFVKRSLTSQIRTSYEIIGSPSKSEATQTSTTYYDISYLLNTSFWDSYYFSTIPRSGESKPENPALIRFGNTVSTDLKDPVNAASLLMVDGAFNVNSTDKNAWKAFLGSAKHFTHNADQAASTDAAFPRSLEQLSTSATPPTGSDADSFSGFRRLNDAQLDALAEEIVKQVRLRGPFLSLSHFVNRALAEVKTDPQLTRCGALQCAIDESGANINFASNKNVFSSINAIEDAVTLREKNSAPRADFDGGDTDGRPADADSANPDWAKTSRDNNYGAIASIIADREMLKDAKYKPEQGYRSTGIPGWLTQADVLQVIGPALTARSDTFRIRAFGETLDPTGKSVAKAYCEAIVQRVPLYTDPANPSSARGTTLSNINTIHGRQFQIVSFRWLSSQEV